MKRLPIPFAHMPPCRPVPHGSAHSLAPHALDCIARCQARPWLNSAPECQCWLHCFIRTESMPAKPCGWSLLPLVCAGLPSSRRWQTPSAMHACSASACCLSNCTTTYGDGCNRLQPQRRQGRPVGGCAALSQAAQLPAGTEAVTQRWILQQQCLTLPPRISPRSQECVAAQLGW